MAVNAELKEGEKLMAFLDDVYVCTPPERIGDAHAALSNHLSTKAGICLHHGQNQDLEFPRREARVRRRPCKGSSTRESGGRGVARGSRVAGDQTRAESSGVPVGHRKYILSQLEQKADEHKELLRRIPFVQDVQAAWLLLLYCAVPRANFWLRTVQPEMTVSYAERHDQDLWACLSDVLQVDVPCSEVVSSASLPLSLGGVGLGSAQRIRQAANWASWADCLEMVQARHPTVAAAMIEGITRNTQGCMGSVAQSAHALEEIG